MVELRKRKAPAAAPMKPAKASKTTAAPKKSKSGVRHAESTRPTITKAPVDSQPKAAPKQSAGKISTGDSIELDGFGSEIQLNDGTPTTLFKLVEASKAGVVLFTYPKASTPGCTTQVCLFRDSFTPLTSTGLDIYGLSTDSTNANTNFKTKQNLPYSLLCDPKASLIGAIGFKKSPSGTQRGVFVVDKAGKVLAAEAGGPAATVEAVKKLIT